MVTDREDKTGVIVSTANNLCQVEYPDGQVYGWTYCSATCRAGPTRIADGGQPSCG